MFVRTQEIIQEIVQESASDQDDASLIIMRRNARQEDSRASSSNGRALDLHSRGSGIDAHVVRRPHLRPS